MTPSLRLLVMANAAEKSEFHWRVYNGPSTTINFSNKLHTLIDGVVFGVKFSEKITLLLNNLEIPISLLQYDRLETYSKPIEENTEMSLILQQQELAKATVWINRYFKSVLKLVGLKITGPIKTTENPTQEPVEYTYVWLLQGFLTKHKLFLVNKNLYLLANGKLTNLTTLTLIHQEWTRDNVQIIAQELFPSLWQRIKNWGLK